MKTLVYLGACALVWWYFIRETPPPLTEENDNDGGRVAPPVDDVDKFRDEIREFQNIYSPSVLSPYADADFQNSVFSAFPYPFRLYRDISNDRVLLVQTHRKTESLIWLGARGVSVTNIAIPSTSLKDVTMIYVSSSPN